MAMIEAICVLRGFHVVLRPADGVEKRFEATSNRGNASPGVGGAQQIRPTTIVVLA